MHNQVRKVLLVDDDAGYIEHLEHALRQRGYQTCSASDGASGLLAAHAEQPDLIVLDADMPVMNGYQMLQVLRSDPTIRQAPIILLTTRGDEHEISRGWLNGADICLPHGSGFAD